MAHPHALCRRSALKNYLLRLICCGELQFQKDSNLDYRCLGASGLYLYRTPPIQGYGLILFPSRSLDTRSLRLITGARV